MSEGGAPPQSGFELRAPTSGAGALDPRSALILWGGGSVVLGGVITYLLVQSQFRLLVMLLLGVMGLACLAPIRGIFILTAFLPCMYLVRRSVLAVEAFSERDPILLFPAITTLAMSVSVVLFYGPTVFRYLKRSALLKLSLVLMVVFLAEVVNPIQGSVFVGMAGGMYFIIPMLWLLMGLLLERHHITSLFKMILVIGVLTSVYGLYQHFFGLSRIEIYELRAKQFLKAFDGIDNVRVMSTFAGLADFARYLSFSSFIAFAFFWKSKRSVYLIALMGIQMWAMLYTAVRTSFLVAFFSGVILMTLTGKDARRIALRATLATLMVSVLYVYLARFDPRAVYRQDFSTNPFVVHTISGMTHPTEEGSFQSRIANWKYVVLSTMWQHPIGRGLGSTTTAARKFAGGQQYEADSYFFELFYGSGLFAFPFFIGLVWVLVGSMMRLSKTSEDPFLYHATFALMAGIILSSVFGITMRDNIIGPFAWLLVGWIAKEEVERREAALSAVVLPRAGI